MNRKRIAQRLVISIVLCFPFMEITFAQTFDDLKNGTVEDIFRPKLPTEIDTLYYPFYGGIQMIEVDHIGYWDRKIFFLEQSEPRAMPHSMFHPMPIGNEYFFRDTAGNIVKAFNTKHSLSELTRKFAQVPIRKKWNGKSILPQNHRNQMDRDGVWYQSPQRKFNFSGHYKVSTGYPEQVSNQYGASGNQQSSNLKFGLIDSLGNVVIPMEYNAIFPLNNTLMVQKDTKWGMINYENKILVALSYDSYELNRNHQSIESQKIVDVFFLTLKDTKNYNPSYSFDALFSAKDNKLIPLNKYDNLNHEYSWSPIEGDSKRFMVISKNGKTGLLNEHYEEIVPPNFEIFEFNKNSKGLFRVSKSGKFGFLDRNFKEIIPPEYDYAESFQSDSTALVFKHGVFYRINTKNKKLLNGYLNPNWKTGHLGFVTDKNFVSVKTGEFFGIFDESSNTMIAPFIYDKLIAPIQITSFFDINKAAFKEKNIELSDKPDMIDELLFHQNKIIVKNTQNQYGIIDSTFQILIDFKYDNLESIPCELEYLLYTHNGKKGVMDYAGKDLFNEVYEDVRYDIHYEQERDIFKVKKNGKWGVINFDNKILVPFEYDSIKFLGHWNRLKVKLWVVEKNAVFGVVDENNTIFVPFEYKGISHLSGNNLWVEGENKVRYKVVLKD